MKKIFGFSALISWLKPTLFLWGNRFALILISPILYLFVLALVAIFITLKWFGYIKITNWEEFPHSKESVIVIANHPSVIDPFLVAIMFYKSYLIRPIRRRPLIVADRNLFYDSWRWFWLRPFMIPVERGNKESELASFRTIEEALKKGTSVIIFPEGGRTFRGEHFMYSQNGKKIRALKEGVALLVRRTRATVVILWLEGTETFSPNSNSSLFAGFRISKETEMIIRVGKHINFLDKETKTMPSRSEIIQTIAISLLELADQE